MKYFISIILCCLLSFCGRTQIITTIAGNGGGIVDTGDGGPATNAVTYIPGGLCFDKLGNLFVAEGGGGRKVRKITPAGIISTVAGTGSPGSSGDGGPATNATFRTINSLCIDDLGNIFVADLDDNRIRKIDAVTGIINTVAGTGVGGFLGDGGPATAARLYGPTDVCIDRHGNLFIADIANLRVRKVAPNGIISTVVGNGSNSPAYYGGDGGRADTTAIHTPYGLCVDDTGNLYISDGRFRIMKVDTFGMIRTFAGNGVMASIGESIPATAASVIAVRISMDHNNNMYLSEWTGSHKVRKISNSGIITTVAGMGTGGYSGDGGPATSAHLNAPWDVVTDTCGNIYIADSWNNRVRKVFFYPECPDTTGGGDDTVALAGEVEKTNDVLIFPNPAGNVVTIKSPTKLTYTLMGITGQIIMSGTITSGTQSMPVAHLPAGVYFITTTSPQGIRSVKRVVKE
ncbi:MAG: T9SS type A sorting domain-containing protein [Chitinophagaceae bacterium]|nr:T9SS type A sorting domain-containing protein [Chitinophagaceae bacterium]